MTPLEFEAARALMACRWLPGMPAKRYIRQLLHAHRVEPETRLTDEQAAYLWACVIRYRRQLPGDLVAVARQLVRDPSRALSEVVVPEQLGLPL